MQYRQNAMPGGHASPADVRLMPWLKTWQAELGNLWNAFITQPAPMHKGMEMGILGKCIQLRDMDSRTVLPVYIYPDLKHPGILQIRALDMLTQKNAARFGVNIAQALEIINRINMAWPSCSMYIMDRGEYTLNESGWAICATITISNSPFDSEPDWESRKEMLLHAMMLFSMLTDALSVAITGKGLDDDED